VMVITLSEAWGESPSPGAFAPTSPRKCEERRLLVRFARPRSLIQPDGFARALLPIASLTGQIRHGLVQSSLQK
jgi:hypothetical protein